MRATPERCRDDDLKSTNIDIGLAEARRQLQQDLEHMRSQLSRNATSRESDGDRQQQEENSVGPISNFFAECASSGGKDVPVVEFVLPPPDYHIGLPSDFEFSLVEASQRSCSRNIWEARPVAFVDLGRNVDAFAELAARKRDEAIGACIDSALDLLFRDRDTSVTHERRDFQCDVGEAVPIDALADVLLRMEEHGEFAAASNGDLWLSSLASTSPAVEVRHPPSSPFAVSNALAAAMVAAAIPPGEKDSSGVNGHWPSRCPIAEAPCRSPADSPLAVSQALEKAIVDTSSAGKPPPSPPESINMSNEPFPEPLPEPPTQASPEGSAIADVISPFNSFPPTRELTFFDEVDGEFGYCENDCLIDRPISLEDRNHSSPARPGRSMFPHSFLAYKSGDEVEYFSSTHHRWIYGSMNTLLHEDSSLISYSVHIGIAGQLRDNVCLEVVRAPLREDEPVELLDTRCGAWLPARICGRQATYATQVGYRVQLEGSSTQIIEMAPAERLRRRFPPRQQVEIYKGTVAGWRRAIVHPNADHLQPSPACLRSMPHRAAPHQAESYLETQLWKPVPLHHEEGTGQAALWVPSYLLRFPKPDRGGFPRPDAKDLQGL